MRRALLGGKLTTAGFGGATVADITPPALPLGMNIKYKAIYYSCVFQAARPTLRRRPAVPFVYDQRGTTT